MAGDVIPIPPPPLPLPRQDPNFSPAGDFFAPFFDVTFYAPTQEDGQIEALDDAADSASGIDSVVLRVKAAKLRANQRRELEHGTIAPSGPSTLSIRSVDGGLQSYGPAGEESEVAQLTNFRANLQVTMLSAAALQATLTLTPPYEDALRIVDHKLIRFGSIMEIQWGYLTLGGEKPAVSDIGFFRITQPSIKFGKQVSVTIEGYDILSSSLKTSDTRCQWLRETYPCDLDIIREMTKRVGPTAKLDDKKISSSSSLRKRKSGTGVTQADDDWVFFRRILRQNDCVFEQVGDVITLKEERFIDQQEPKYRLFWFKQPVNQFDVPMISFETNPIMSLFVDEPGSRGQRTICRDPETKKLTVIDKDPGTTGTPQVGQCNTGTTEAAHKKIVVKTSQGDKGVFAKLDAACTSGRFFTQPCKRPNQTEEINRENNEIRRFFNTRASATCPGVPGLLPQQVVEVHDVGTTFSGNYRVMKVVHNIGKGYTVKLDLLRASESNKQGSGAPASTDKKNTKGVDQDKSSGQNVEPILVPAKDREGKLNAHAGCVDAEATAARDAAVAKAKAAAAAVSAAAAAQVQAISDAGSLFGGS